MKSNVAKICVVILLGLLEANVLAGDLLKNFDDKHGLALDVKKDERPMNALPDSVVMILKSNPEITVFALDDEARAMAYDLFRMKLPEMQRKGGRRVEGNCKNQLVEILLDGGNYVDNEEVDIISQLTMGIALKTSAGITTLVYSSGGVIVVYPSGNQSLSDSIFNGKGELAFQRWMGRWGKENGISKY